MAFAAAFPRSSAAVGTGGVVLVVAAVAFTVMAKGDFPTGGGSHARRIGSILPVLARAERKWAGRSITTRMLVSRD